MADTTIQNRAAGAIMGAFIGDALGLGPHWYYDLSELRRDYGRLDYHLYRSQAGPVSQRSEGRAAFAGRHHSQAHASLARRARWL